MLPPNDTLAQNLPLKKILDSLVAQHKEVRTVTELSRYMLYNIFISGAFEVQVSQSKNKLKLANPWDKLRKARIGSYSRNVV